MDLYPAAPLINLLIWALILGAVYAIARIVPFLEGWVVHAIGIVCSIVFVIIVIKTLLIIV